MVFFCFGVMRQCAGCLLRHFYGIGTPNAYKLLLLSNREVELRLAFNCLLNSLYFELFHQTNPHNQGYHHQRLLLFLLLLLLNHHHHHHHHHLPLVGNLSEQGEFGLPKNRAFIFIFILKIENLLSPIQFISTQLLQTQLTSLSQ